VEAATLNPSDILFMRGEYNITLDLPFTPGWEGSGTVVGVARGSGMIARSLKGKRVAFVKQQEIGHYRVGGSYADYAVTDD